MKRIILAIGALVVAFALAFVGYFWVDSSCEKLKAQLNVICDFAESNDIENAKIKSQEAVAAWEEVHGVIESFIRHEETDKLEETIKSLPIYAKQGNMERLEQQADLAIDELTHLIRSEKPLISNIF